MANLLVEANGFIVVPTTAVYVKPCCGRDAGMGGLQRLKYGDRVEVEDSPVIQRLIAGGLLIVIEDLSEPEPEARGDIRERAEFEELQFQFQQDPVAELQDFSDAYEFTEPEPKPRRKRVNRKV